jgi:succinate dehydrogenase / fumarate reductase iron-sulfur subunit
LTTVQGTSPGARLRSEGGLPATADAASGKLQVSIWRGDAQGGEFERYEVERREGEVVLDVVHRVQAELAPDLAVRWNCKAGKCGSCSAEVNGLPRLMCMTRVDMVAGQDGEIVIAPLRTFPIIKDLVTDVSFNYEVAKRITPLQLPEQPEGGYRMYQEDIERAQEFHKCIECFLCQTVCHVIRDHEENKARYAGPRYFVRIAELEMHPLDTADRRRELKESFGLGYCNITKCCTEVCPESIKITDNAIIPLKERVVDKFYDPITALASAVRLRGRRRKSTSAS